MNMKPMTPHTPEGTVIEDLDALYAKATKGPWRVWHGNTRRFIHDDIRLIVALVNAWPTIRTMLRPDSSGEAVRLRALCEGLECEAIDTLLNADAEILRAVGREISTAAKLGADLYAARKAALAAAERSGG